MMLVVLGNTELSLIDGISIAGANPELTKFTPPADAEYIFYDKPKIIDAIPVTPQGHPTPAIITKACYELAKFPISVVRAGTFLAPLIPHNHISDSVGRDFRKTTALPNAEEIMDKSKLLGRELSKIVSEIVIGESTPAGTTTAQAVLWALGYKAKTSSASPKNPQELKRAVIEEGFKRAGVEFGELADEPLKALKEFGDPMLACVLGISLSFEGNVVLAGGTQMLAVSALLKALNVKLNRFKIATTRWIVEDKSATFEKTAEEIGVEYYVAQLDFSESEFNGLRDYEKGFVKEGVGAGGAVYLAEKKGFSCEDVFKKVEDLYRKLVT
ncbi:nicotinate mononucleotide-dependent phosphoribosyltransferase CobT [Archaeoglobus sp.]